MSSTSSVSPVSIPQTSSSSTDPMPDRLQAAAELGKYFYPSDRDVLNCGIPLLTLFTKRVFDICHIANQTNPHFFPSMIKGLSENSPGQKHRYIHYFSNLPMKTGEGDLQCRNTAIMYIFCRFLSDAIADEPSQETDFSELIYLMEAFTKFYENELSTFIINSQLCQEEFRKQGLLVPDKIKKTVEKGIKNIQGVINFFKLSSRALEFNDLDLLKKTPLEIGLDIGPFTKRLQYRSIFNNLIEVFLILNDFHYIRAAHTDFSQSTPIFLKKQIFLETNLKNFRRMLELNKTISYASKVELFSHISRYTNRIFNNNKQITLVEQRMFSEDPLEFYKGVVASLKAQAIAGVNVSWNNKKDTEESYIDLYPPTSDIPVFPEYAEENRETIQNFIPRLREAVGFISAKSDQIKKDLLICQYAPYFILKGDVPALVGRIQTARGNQAKIDAIIYREIKKFSREANPATGSSQEARISIASQNEFDQLEEIFCSVRKIPKALFSCQIERADEWSSHLFPHPSQPVPLRPSRVRLQHPIPSSAFSEPQDFPSFQLPEPSKVATSSNSSISTSPSTTSPVEIIASSSNSDRQAPSFYEELEESRRLLQRWVNNLASSRSPVTQSALKNSFEHFDNLLSGLRRIKNLSERQTVTQGDLFSFVNDSVRHCTLGVEQLLSALYRETNGIKTKEELAPHLTHDLFQILHNCNMGHGDLPRDVRKWLGEINHGETTVRDINLYSEDDTVLQNLLRASRRLSEVSGSASSSTETSNDGAPLFEALFDYLSPLGKLLQTIQDRFPVKKSMAQVRLEEPLTNLIDSFCSQMEQVAVAPSQPLSEEGPYAQLKEIRSLFLAQLSTEPRPILDNILENLLVHLQTQMKSHSHLEPIEASLHLGNVLLLNQLIVEAVLIDSVRSKMIDLSYEEENQHDLFAFVQKLQIEKGFSKEELDFLKSGKTSRQFIRYPASYSKPRSSKAPLSRLDKMLDLLTWGRKLANKQTAKEDLHGFTSANPADAKKLREVQVFAANDIELMCSVVKKVLG
ncbi:MAG: hypothetical protein JSR39_01925 [Verrucomicrobia bacterium]|nr:hypothetical protein [Verrucomicrobiota bacterium]